MDEIRNLSDRVCTLETKIRRQIAFTAFLVLGLAVTLVMGQAKALQPATTVHDELRAKRFLLVDDDGDWRAALGFSPGQMSGMRSIPGTETARLTLYGKKKSGHLTLFVTHHGTPLVSFTDNNGKIRMSARLLPDGNPVLWFIDDDEKERIKLSLDKGGKPSILFMDEDGLETIFAP